MGFPFMISRLLSTTAWLALLAAPIGLIAQNVSTTANEDERIEALLREQSEFYRPKSSVTVGFRMLTSGVNVKFGNLGIVNRSVLVGTSPAGDQTVRQYDNGSVTTDLLRLRSEETAETTVSANGRYQTFTTLNRLGPDGQPDTADDFPEKVQNGDYLSYQAGRTRIWSYGSELQATAKPGYIAMNSYSASSTGASLEKDQGGSSGVEMQYARLLRRLTNKRFEINLVAGVALNSINNKTSGSVQSNLRTTTDYYSLNGQTAPPLPADGTLYSAPNRVDFTNAQGDTFANGKETTVAISDTPAAGLSTTNVLTPGGVEVRGNWQVKGAYFMMRVGPSFRAQLTEHFGLNASVGLAGAYAGTRYTAIESFSVPNRSNEVSNTDPDFAETNPTFSDKNQFLGGYYADVNMEWMANETTGLFGGVSAQKFGGYDQELGGRTARIDLGSSVGLRGGVSIKF
jgi:hypothetical protein